MDYIIQEAIRGAVDKALKDLPASVDVNYAAQSRKYLTTVIKGASEQPDADALRDLGDALPAEVPQRDDRLQALLAMYRAIVANKKNVRRCGCALAWLWWCVLLARRHAAPG